jgi:hypothetical protein
LQFLFINGFLLSVRLSAKTEYSPDKLQNFHFRPNIRNFFVLSADSLQFTTQSALNWNNRCQIIDYSKVKLIVFVDKQINHLDETSPVSAWVTDYSVSVEYLADTFGRNHLRSDTINFAVLTFPRKLRCYFVTADFLAITSQSVQTLVSFVRFHMGSISSSQTA